MRFKQLFQPADASFSTPKAARKLLRLFALVLQFALFSALYAYLISSFEDEVSLRRGYLSGSISVAQRFFTGNEVLLRNLSLSAVRNRGVQETIPTVSDEELHVRLGRGEVFWSLWLTERKLDYLRQNKISLLYVEAGSKPQILHLPGARQEERVVPQSVLQKLEQLTSQGLPPEGELWLHDTSSRAPESGSSLYLFSLLDEREPSSGWLGLEIEDGDVLAALSSDRVGEFLVLNAQGNEVFASASYPSLSQAVSQLQGDKYFGFVGQGWLPDSMIMRKHLGYTDLQVIYAIDFRSVFLALRGPLLLVVLLGIASVAATWLLVTRIEKRLIAPAIYRDKSLVESEAFSRAVIQTAPVALCVLRRMDGAVVLQNHLSEQWLGAGDVREQRRQGWIGQAFDSPAGEGTDEFETCGRHLILSYSATRYRGEDVLFCAFSDISAHKQVEAALEHARQWADTANEAKTQFLATMSHEIRTPLYGVLGTLELLARTTLNTQQTNYLHAIEGSSSTLLQLISDVLDVAKIEAGQLFLEESEISTLDLIQEVIEGFSAAAINKGLHLYAQVDPQLPERLKGDLTRIRQILNNLLSNAVKFTESGRIVLRVKVESRDDERVCVLWQVSDTGAGISAEHQQLLFAPFYQVGHNTGMVAGTGLGLSICQRLTSLMNGSLRVVSEPGLGSSFILKLPLEQDLSGDAPTAPRLLLETVYVVSPSRELAENICGWLRRWGARAQIGIHSEQGLEASAVLVQVQAGDLAQPRPGLNIPLVQVCDRVSVSSGDRKTASWQVNLSNLLDLRRAVGQAQGSYSQADGAQTGAVVLPQLGLHLLVAEDNAISRLILKDQLEELGCTAQLAADGHEALALWHEGAFDAVLTDINMPNMNGYELVAQLRRLGCDLPIIGATANALSDERERCLAAGMDECLIKPFGLRALSNNLQHNRSKSRAL